MSVFGYGRKRVFVLHTTYVLRVSYHTVVVLCYFFWFWREIVFGATYVLSVQYSCAVVLVFRLWQEMLLQLEKKSSSRLSGRCAIIITTGKKSSSRDFYVKLNVSNLNVTNLY